jgi:hypothetical protein
MSKLLVAGIPLYLFSLLKHTERRTFLVQVLKNRRLVSGCPGLVMH